MQRHEAGLVELRFTDTETGRLQVQNDIDKIQSEGFASPETRTGEQPKDGLEGRRQERPFLPGSGRSMEDGLDFFGEKRNGLGRG